MRITSILAIAVLVASCGSQVTTREPTKMPDKLPVETFVGKLYTGKGNVGFIDVPQKPGSDRASINYVLIIPKEVPHGFAEAVIKLDGKWVQVGGVPGSMRWDGNDRCIMVYQIAEVLP